jgi:hypothetical protein
MKIDNVDESNKSNSMQQIASYETDSRSAGKKFRRMRRIVTARKCHLLCTEPDALTLRLFKIGVFKLACPVAGCNSKGQRRKY